MEELMEEFYPAKLVCWPEPDDGPHEYLLYLPYMDTPVGRICPNCLEPVEPNDGVHSWCCFDPVAGWSPSI